MHTKPLRTTIGRTLLPLLVLASLTTATHTHADQDEQRFIGHDCFESHGYFTADPDDFDPAMPEGFSLVRDDTGRGTIVAATRACDSAQGPFVSLLAVVLVHAPAALAWPGADHAILLSPSMVDGAAFHDTLGAWGITVPRLTQMDVRTSNVADTLAESRTRADPDFLLTVQGGQGPDTLPLAKLRTFQMDLDTRQITAAYDTERANVVALSGPATAHFVWQGFGDIPDHRIGTGAVMVSGPIGITFQTANLPRA